MKKARWITLLAAGTVLAIPECHPVQGTVSSVDEFGEQRLSELEEEVRALRFTVDGPRAASAACVAALRRAVLDVLRGTRLVGYALERRRGGGAESAALAGKETAMKATCLLIGWIVLLGGCSAPRAPASGKDVTAPGVGGGFSLPAENLHIPEALEPCAENLRLIRDAIVEYVCDKGCYPDWLSDLVPEFLSAEELLCPLGHAQQAFYAPDPYLPCSYGYQYGRAAYPRSAAPYRDVKRQQRAIYGDVVPLVRCYCHPPFVLSISFAGQVFRSISAWEMLFLHDDRRPKGPQPGDAASPTVEGPAQSPACGR
jgi:hypothetical protein